MIDERKLTKCATTVLTEHLGVAAEFVVDDALNAVRASSTSGDMPDAVFLDSWFITLGGMLPPSVPLDSVRRQITRLYEQPSTP